MFASENKKTGQTREPNMYMDSNSNTLHIKFDSVTHATKFALAKGLGKTQFGKDRANNNLRRADTGASSTNFHNGHNTTTIQQSLKKAREDVLKNVERIRDQLIDKLNPPQRRRRKRRHGMEDGDTLDAVAVTQRDPNAWSKTVKERRPATVVRIGVNYTAAGSERPSTVLYRGAVAAAIADVLQSQGQNVEIIAYANVWERSSNRYALSEIPVKASDAPFDMNNVATVCADIGFMRIVDISAYYRAVGNPDRGAGVPRPMNPENAKSFDYLVDKDVRSKETAEQWIADKLGISN